jgi:hypothetical protein
MAKAKQIRLPKGIFVYPYLTRPDNYKSIETYKCILRVPIKDAEETVNFLDAMMLREKDKDTVMNDGEVCTYSDPYTAWKEDESGEFIEFVTKLKKFGGRKGEEFEQRPDIFDSKLQPIPTDIDILSGSTGSLIVWPFRWGSGKEGKIGISLRLAAAQVNTINDTIERSGASYGFAVEESGFDVESNETLDVGQGDDEVDASVREAY